jgi:hypothetical protein
MNKIENGKKSKTYTARRRVSMIMFFMFILLIPSGIMMHIYDGHVLNHGRHLAMLVHNICAIVFVITGLFHIKYNFSAVKKYLTDLWRIA